MAAISGFSDTLTVTLIIASFAILISVFRGPAITLRKGRGDDPAGI
jgi:hypothetical protein